MGHPLLELDDIQSGILRPRPAPYAATYTLLRIDDRVAGRELLGQLGSLVASAAHVQSPGGEAWISVALTYRGLVALGVPRESLDSFAWEFRQGMAARAAALGDTGESAPERWERPLGGGDVHVVVVAIAPGVAELEAAFAPVRSAWASRRGVEVIWRQDCRALASCKEHFGYRDAIGYPPIEGSPFAGATTRERPLEAGEFILGYEDETGSVPSLPQPEILGRNGTYVAFRKLQQRVAEFRRYLRHSARSADDEELLAAKMMGRWRSGAPLALCPHDDPVHGSDPLRQNDFDFSDDPIGYKTPPGCHIRRANPRDASVAGVVRLHRMIRRGTVYGPELPAGVLEDDGIDRGVMFGFIGAHPGRQFEFVQSEWIEQGEFLGMGEAKDPVVGVHDGTGSFSIPTRPIARRLRGLPRFVVHRGGEYGFMPGLRALRWLSELRS